MVTDPLSRAVPYEVRDFADRSVEQAKKAFDGFIGVVNAAITGELPHPADEAASATTASQLAIAFAMHNVQGAFELAQKMVHAKDLSYMLELQRDFLEAQIAALTSQMRSLDRAISAERPQTSAKSLRKPN